jgi:hypothetical protein
LKAVALVSVVPTPVIEPPARVTPPTLWLKPVMSNIPPLASTVEPEGIVLFAPATSVPWLTVVVPV